MSLAEIYDYRSLTKRIKCHSQLTPQILQIEKGTIILNIFAEEECS